MPARNVKGRLVYWKISQSQQLAKVSVWAKLLFTWLIPNVDNLGRADANPHIVKGTIFPLDQEITPDRCGELIKELHKSGLIILYSFRGLEYLCIPKITSYQKLMGRMTEASDYPCPSDEDIKKWEQGFNEVYTGTYQVHTKSVPKVKVKVKVKVKEKVKEEGENYTAIVVKFFDSLDSSWLKTLQAAYPKVNLTTELGKMKAWLVSNPDKQKKNIKRFAVNWLSRNKPEGDPIPAGEGKVIITDRMLEDRLGRIATKDMIKKLMQEIPQNLWWKVDQYLRKRYPGSNGSTFAEAEHELMAEAREGKDRLSVLTGGIGKAI